MRMDAVRAFCIIVSPHGFIRSSIGTSVWADLSLDGRIQSFLKEIYDISNLDAQIINEVWS